MASIRVYHHPVSGHSHRVRLFLSLLGLPFEAVEVDITQGAHKRPEFLAMNHFGQLPVIQDGDVTLADSNAILTYLAMRYDETGQWLPRDPVGAAQVQRWLSVAAGPLAYGPAAARVNALFQRPHDPKCEVTATQLFAAIETQLKNQPYLVGAKPTIADVALYTYTAHAPEGGVSLEPYPLVRSWLQRIEALPHFVGMARNKALV